MTSFPLRLVKQAHACVEVQRGTERLVVDPGALDETPRLDECVAMLVSHGHFDHADRRVLEGAIEARVPVFGPSDLGSLVGSQTVADGMSVLRAGEQRTIEGFLVEVVGGRHATVHPDLPGPENLGYLVEGRILITGDEHPRVDTPVEVLVTPVDAPWLRAVDLIEYVRRVKPSVVIGVHDGLLNDAGLVVADSVLESLTSEGAGRAFRLSRGQHFDLTDV